MPQTLAAKERRAARILLQQEANDWARLAWFRRVNGSSMEKVEFNFIMRPGASPSNFKTKFITGNRAFVFVDFVPTQQGKAWPGTS
jgi:hypothetical protein